MAGKTLFEQIINYRLSHKESRVLFGTIIGEIQRDPKVNKSNTINNPSDADCERVIKKLIQFNKDLGTPELLEENELLINFLPKQLTQSEVNSIVLAIEAKSIGECMKYFKDYYFGLYNGKEVQESFNKYIKK